MPACKASTETRDLLVRRVQTVLMEKKEKWFDFFLSVLSVALTLRTFFRAIQEKGDTRVKRVRWETRWVL